MALRQQLEYLAFRLVRAVCTLLPESLAIRLGATLGFLAGSFLRFRRVDVDRHLEWCFPDRTVAWRRKVARGSYAHLGREGVVLFRSRGWSTEQILERTRVVGFQDFRRAAYSGTGVVLLTGHLGSWDIGGASIAARGVPLDVIGKGMTNRQFEKDLFEARERIGMHVIEAGEASIGALRSLRRGRVVALLGDQSAHRGGVLVPFFGRSASTPRGPALFSIRSGASVFVAFAIRDRGWEHRYTVTFHSLPFASTDDLNQDTLLLLEGYNALLEAAVRATPEQYLWQHRRWKVPLQEEQGSEE